MREPRDMRPSSKTVISQSVTIIILTIAFAFAAYYALTYRALVDDLQMRNHYLENCAPVAGCLDIEGGVDNKD